MSGPIRSAPGETAAARAPDESERGTWPVGFRITGSTPARYLVLTLPGQLLDLYDQVGTAAAERRLPDGGIPPSDIERWLQLAPAYGLQVVGPPIPESDPA